MGNYCCECNNKNIDDGNLGSSKIKWELGIGEWNWDIGHWELGIGPNPQSPIPNPHPQSPFNL